MIAREPDSRFAESTASAVRPECRCGYGTSGRYRAKGAHTASSTWRSSLVVAGEKLCPQELGGALIDPARKGV